MYQPGRTRRPIYSEDELAEKWQHIDAFSINIAASLWVGEVPPAHWADQIDEKDVKKNTVFSLATSRKNLHRLLKIRKRLQKAIFDGKNGSLEVIEFCPSHKYDQATKKDIPDHTIPHPTYTIVSRKALEKWAESQSLYPIFLFDRSVEEASRLRLILALLDEKNEFFVKEFVISGLLSNQNHRNIFPHFHRCKTSHYSS